MMSVKQKESKLFYNFSLSGRIPKDHFLRKIDEAVDFSFIHDLARRYYSHTGQPGIDPVVLFKMMLIGYLYDITSERKLAQELKVNLAFMYFLGYDLDEETPNHSVLSKARRRFGAEVFERFFEHIVQECKTRGLIEAEKSFIDSTLIPANASLYSVIDCDQKIELKRTPKEYLEALDDVNPDSGDNAPDEDKPKLPKNERSYSTTDPDASIIKRKNKPMQLCYKQHIAVDGGKARIITACSTTPAAIADEHKLPHLISKSYEKHGILPKDVGCDTKYGTADNYRFLIENNIKPSITYAGGKNSSTGLMSKDEFIYDKLKDQYMCPEGRELKYGGFIKKQRHLIYRALAKHCKACGSRTQCTNSPQGRSVIRHINESYVEKAKEHLKSAEAKLTIDERSYFVETVFASEKKDLGLKRAKFRGLANVTIQSLVTAASYNLKKLVKYAKGYGQKLKTAMPPPVLSECVNSISPYIQRTRIQDAALFIKERLILLFCRPFAIIQLN